ncbi:MAG: hypothetical protein ACI93S_000776, partial [Ancylomarina sp.]
FTGLRPGEKLYEELLARSEDTLPTHNDKIMIGQVRPHNYEDVNTAISQILYYLNVEDNDMLVARMKDLVPEFISKNSVYELLDDQGEKTKQELLMFDNNSTRPKEKVTIPVNSDIVGTRKSTNDLLSKKEINPKLNKKSILSLRKQKLINSSLSNNQKT